MTSPSIEPRLYPCDRDIAARLGVEPRQQTSPETLQAKGLLQTALNALPMQIAILNRFGVVVDWNHAFSRFLAEQKRELGGNLSGTKYSTLLPGIVSKPVATAISHRLARLLAGRDETFTFDYKLRVGDETRTFRLHGARFAWERDVRFIISNDDGGAANDRKREARELLDHQLALQEEERQRIAKELHDSTAQNLVAIGLNLMLLRARGPADVTATQLWDDTEGCLAEVLKEIRTITYLLYSPQLQSEGLRHSLSRFIEGFGQRTGIETRSRINGDVDRIALPVQRSTLRIVQEALSNVHRHACASQVAIDLRLFSGRLYLVITDNGRGIKGMVGEEETEAFRPGVGIPGMRARLRELGGNLRIASGERGTRIVATIPVMPGLNGGQCCAGGEG